MQNLGAETDHWCALARERGPGWRVWRWEAEQGMMIVWRFRLLAPGEAEPVGEEGGVVIPV